jgi:hypothetical protein
MSSSMRSCSAVLLPSHLGAMCSSCCVVSLLLLAAIGLVLADDIDTTAPTTSDSTADESLASPHYFSTTIELTRDQGLLEMQCEVPFTSLYPGRRFPDDDDDKDDDPSVRVGVRHDSYSSHGSVAGDPSAERSIVTLEAWLDEPPTAYTRQWHGTLDEQGLWHPWRTEVRGSNRLALTVALPGRYRVVLPSDTDVRASMKECQGWILYCAGAQRSARGPIRATARTVSPWGDSGGHFPDEGRDSWTFFGTTGAYPSTSLSMPRGTIAVQTDADLCDLMTYS